MSRRALLVLQNLHDIFGIYRKSFGETISGSVGNLFFHSGRLGNKGIDQLAHIRIPALVESTCYEASMRSLRPCDEQ